MKKYIIPSFPEILAVALIGFSVLGLLPFRLDAADAPARSVEMRWFFAGAAPEPIKTWFTGSNDLGPGLSEEDSERRTDLYLLAAGRDSIGIKLRGSAVTTTSARGELELKLRKDQSEASFSEARGSGKLELWEKWSWSYTGSGADAVTQAFIENPLSVRVDKIRYQRKYLVSNDQRIVAVSLKKKLDKGCTVEFVELEVSGTAWWTIALDGIGEVEPAKAAILRCATSIFRHFPMTVPTASQAESYPAWLLSLRSTTSTEPADDHGAGIVNQLPQK